MNDGEIKNHAALLCSTYAMEHSSSINHMSLKLLNFNHIDDDTFLQSLIGHDMSRWMNCLPPRHIAERTMWVLFERVKEKKRKKKRKKLLTLRRTPNPQPIHPATKRARCQAQLFSRTAGPLDSPIEQRQRLKNVPALFVYQGPARTDLQSGGQIDHGRINM